MASVMLFLVSCLVGYILFLYFNDPIDNPRKKKNRLPKLHYKNLELLPYFRIHIKSKTYHIHHWLTLTLITGVTVFWFGGLEHLIILKGAAVGGIFQGLRYPTRFQFRHPRRK